MSDEIDEIGSELDCEGFESLPRHHLAALLASGPLGPPIDDH